MLHEEAVDTAVLELIRSLQGKDYLKGFYLIGGTALALYIGHRKSADIDLFSDFEFDTELMLENISHDFRFQLLYSAANTLRGTIGHVKTDIIAHRYPYIKEPVRINNISMLSPEDICAMKLNAILTSGQRIKDFIDIFFLMEKFGIADMIGFYRKKYSQYNDTLILKSLIYFEDADISECPVMINDNGPKWNEIKRRIEDAVLSYVKKGLV